LKKVKEFSRQLNFQMVWSKLRCRTSHLCCPRNIRQSNSSEKELTVRWSQRRTWNLRSK